MKKRLTDKPERIELSESHNPPSSLARVFEDGRSWYWWDEKCVHKYGPFRTQLIAEISLARHIREH